MTGVDPLEEYEEDRIMRELVASVTQNGFTKHAEYGFHARRQAFIEEQVLAKANNQTVLSTAATELLEAEKALKKGGRRNRNTWAETIKKLKFQITGDFLRHRVNVLFVTCNSSVAYELVKLYTFTLCVAEEACQHGIEEFATALGPHREKVLAIVASGDHYQGAPAVYRTGKNEFEKSGEVSFQEFMVQDPGRRFRTYQLDVQYRMHPHISKPHSGIWYTTPGAGTYVRDGEWKPRNPDMDSRMEVACGVLFDAFGYRGERLICVNVEGTSETYPRSGSYVNTKETRAALWLAEQLDYESDYPADEAEDGEVSGDDAAMKDNSEPPYTLGLLTTYTGNERTINAERARMTFTNQSLIVERALTSKAVQGQEFDGAIISLVRSEGPDEETIMNLGWVTDSRVLNVLLSRARGHVFIVANWKDWVRVLRSDEMSKPRLILDKNDNRKFKQFLTYVADNKLIYDFEAVEGYYNAKDQRRFKHPKMDVTKYVAELPKFKAQGVQPRSKQGRTDRGFGRLDQNAKDNALEGIMPGAVTKRAGHGRNL